MTLHNLIKWHILHLFNPTDLWQQITTRCWYLFMKLYTVASQNIIILISTIMRTPNKQPWVSHVFSQVLHAMLTCCTLHPGLAHFCYIIALFLLVSVVLHRTTYSPLNCIGNSDYCEEMPRLHNAGHIKCVRVLTSNLACSHRNIHIYF